MSAADFNSLLQIAHMERDQGWGHQLEVLIFVYWLAHGVSYCVTSRVFDIPKSTVCRVVHKVAKDIRKVKGEIIHFPHAQSIDEVRSGLGRLAHHSVFDKAVGAIDGCHIGIKPPKHNQADYFNYK